MLHVLIIRNAHLPSMKHNLVPPFMIREEGIQVNDTPKIQVNDPTTSDHSIYFPETDFRIPLSLWGVFLYFRSSKPKAQTLQETEEVYLLTPSHWNPHCDLYAQNKVNMLDWEGNMVERKDRMQILIDDLPDGAKTVDRPKYPRSSRQGSMPLSKRGRPRRARKSKLHTVLSLLTRFQQVWHWIAYTRFK